MFQNPKPFLLVEGKKLLPFIKLVPGDVEPFKELFDGTDAQESFCQDTENKEQAIAGIRDNHVREDSVGVSTAFTDQPENRDFLYNGFPVYKVDNAASIVTMNPAVERGSANGADFLFWAEGIHVGIKQNFC